MLETSKLDGWQLHILSTERIIIKNPEPSLTERLEYLKQECELKWELKMLEYARNK